MDKKDDMVVSPKRDDVVVPPKRPSDVVAPPQRPSDVVAPPQRPSDVVVPPKRDDVVAPPKRDDVVVPSQKDDVLAPPKKDDVVAPPKRDDVVAPPKRPSDVVAPPQRPGNVVAPPQNGRNSGETQMKEDKIKTPKMGIKFYLSGYLIWSLLIFVVFGSFGDFTKVILTLYIAASNFTYCWFADYQRYKGGPGPQLFARYFSVSASASIASGMNHTTGSVKRTWTGGYKVSSRRSISNTVTTFLLTYLAMELVKLLINIPIAFYTLFTHQKTLRKYTALIEERGDY